MTQFGRPGPWVNGFVAEHGQRVGYGLGGGGGKDIVHTDEHEQLERRDPIDLSLPLPSTVTYPTGDYDTPQNLTLDTNRRMPTHEGAAGPRVSSPREARDVVVCIPGDRLRQVEAEEADVARREQGGEQGLGYFWQMGRLPKEQPRRLYFVWDGAVRAYHDVTGMERDAGGLGGRLLMNSAIHEVPPVHMAGFRGFRYYAERGEDLKGLTEERVPAPVSQHSLWAEPQPDPLAEGGGTNPRMGQAWSDLKEVPDPGPGHGEATPPPRAPWVAIDLDGTILERPPRPPQAARGPESATELVQPSLGAPLPGVADALQELARLGWRISIYTARFGDETLPDEVVATWAKEIADHLERHGIPFTDVWVGRKPRCDYFVDDRAIRFDGDWDAVLEQLTLEDAPPRAKSEHNEIGGPPPAVGERSGSGGPLDYVESPNDFDDPLGDRGSRGVDRPPELEGALFG